MYWWRLSLRSSFSADGRAQRRAWLLSPLAWMWQCTDKRDRTHCWIQVITSIRRETENNAAERIDTLLLRCTILQYKLISQPALSCLLQTAWLHAPAVIRTTKHAHPVALEGISDGHTVGVRPADGDEQRDEEEEHVEGEERAVEDRGPVGPCAPQGEPHEALERAAA